MTTPGFVDTWPHPFRELDSDGQPDGEPVEVFQLRPDLVATFVAWSEGALLHINGGPAVLLPGRSSARNRLVGLGDFAVLAGTSLHAEPAAGFYTRYTPT